MTYDFKDFCQITKDGHPLLLVTPYTGRGFVSEEERDKIRVERYKLVEHIVALLNAEKE